jgi:hypothetical protein
MHWGFSDLGPFPNFVSLNEQQHNIYAVVDFKVGRFDVNAGVGYGLAPGSDRLMAKMIIGTDLTPGVTNRATDGARSLRKSDSFLPGLPRPQLAARPLMLLSSMCIWNYEAAAPTRSSCLGEARLSEVMGPTNSIPPQALGPIFASLPSLHHRVPFALEPANAGGRRLGRF